MFKSCLQFRFCNTFYKSCMSQWNAKLTQKLSILFIPRIIKLRTLTKASVNFANHWSNFWLSSVKANRFARQSKSVRWTRAREGAVTEKILSFDSKFLGNVTNSAMNREQWKWKEFFEYCTVFLLNSIFLFYLE